MTKLAILLVAATLAGAAAALFWAFVKVGGDFRERELPNVEPDDATGSPPEWPRVVWPFEIGSGGTGQVPQYLAQCGHFHAWGVSCSVLG